MRTLTDELFAPITSAFGFIELPLAEASSALEKWSRRLYRNVSISEIRGGFPESLHALEPLISSHHDREMLISAGQNWTAYFDCGRRGGDAWAAMGGLANLESCRAVVVASRGPSLHEASELRFQLLGPENDGHFLTDIRSVLLAQDGHRWNFTSAGQVQPFEETETYSSRLVRNRFTSAMLERYCRALGIDVFNIAAYGPEAILFETSDYIEQKELKLPPG